MRRLQYLAFAAATLFLTPAVQAADMPPVLRASAPTVEPAASGGWYLRGDIGLGTQRARDWHYNPNPPLGITDTTYQHSLSSTMFIGAGIGYAFNSWFRVDGTLEYRSGGRFIGRDVLSGPGGAYENVLHSNMSSVVALLNGYIDLGTWWGITPYVGAGVGYAWNRLSPTFDTGVVVGVGASSGMINAGTMGNFAWALMAGLAWDVTPSTKIELGYRYMQTGHFRSGAPCPLCTTAVVNYQVRNVNAHDLRIGLRYAFGGGPAAAPIVARY
ncbi:outer membrane protein [Phreatobacter sp.]|uniref:outer membrane protein n=1 Tax=Phreatobacter sp. TaxID=1966341 RepID=UPI003F703F97